MLGLNRLQNDFGTKALFVVLSVLAFLFLAASFAQPARADLLDASGAVVDQASDVIENTTTTVIENDDSDGEATVLDEGVVEGVPPVSEAPIAVIEDVLPVIDDVLEVMGDTPPVLEDTIEVVEIIPPVVEDLLVVVDATPIVEVVEDISTVVEDISTVVAIVEEVPPVVIDVVNMTPPLVLDVVRVLPLFVPNAVVSPGPSEVSSVPVPSSNPLENSLSLEPATDKPLEVNGLITQELVSEMTLFHLADLTSSSTTESPATEPDPDTPGLAPYMPTAGRVAVVGGSGSAASSTSSHSGSSSFGGLDAFSFFAAMAALLALCLVGWIRDRSRSGRSIFPSHGGRPG